MKINEVEFYEFSNHFLVSLHSPKSIVFARLCYPDGKSAQGSNQKVTVEYLVKRWLDFQKLKAERKLADM